MVFVMNQKTKMQFTFIYSFYLRSYAILPLSSHVMSMD